MTPMLAALVLAAAAAIPGPVEEALAAALAVEGRLSIAAWEPALPAGCAPTRAEASGAVRGSGRIAVRVHGAGCEGWGWAQVRVFADALILEAAVSEGEPIAGKVRREAREIRPGQRPLAALPPGAVAARSLPAGRMLEARHVRAPGAAAGEAIRVRLRSGALRIEQTGRVIPCPGDAVCARLPSGARVEGRLVDGALEVGVP